MVEMMPGAGGDQFYYRGYALTWTTVPNTGIWRLLTRLAWSFQQVMTQYTWLATGTECQFRFGQDPIMPDGKIQRSSGVFGGQGIDEIIYKEIAGVQIQFTGGELQN